MNYKDYVLNETAIDLISSDLQDYLNNLNTEKRSVQMFRLTVEETLLNILTHCGHNIKISIFIGRHFGQHIFRLLYKAEPEEKQTLFHSS